MINYSPLSPSDIMIKNNCDDKEDEVHNEVQTRKS